MLHDLDMKYRHTIHGFDLVIKDEEARRLKLRSIVLRDEAMSLKDQLLSRDRRIKELEDRVDDVRGQLESAQEKARRQDRLMLTQSREIANLKVSPVSDPMLFRLTLTAVTIGGIVGVQRRVARLGKDLVRKARPFA
ncbi:uncharacterized protein THITE_2110863 [Thermothielavioides terrestris NRRL 8126]|uniref:Uncharacterized protein n=1 Tax=Thermothielavioides terrestris (strain ATCC 38088 / NRRL 8126) TaxID=578455 RepID=G2QUY0_THETT|nr:uncharacterized protein THITE_2110863 [Thermothielavioides terrestris NRRL 8126]AEO64578.1 hypothetical protein THITE_2110863 [Thermothielavioides terrestris NRRL 8126]